MGEEPGARDFQYIKSVLTTIFQISFFHVLSQLRIQFRLWTIWNEVREYYFYVIYNTQNDCSAVIGLTENGSTKWHNAIYLCNVALSNISMCSYYLLVKIYIYAYIFKNIFLKSLLWDQVRFSNHHWDIPWSPENGPPVIGRFLVILKYSKRFNE